MAKCYNFIMIKDEKVAGYKLLIKQLEGLLSEQSYTLSNLANASALLCNFFADSVFVGFYLYNGEKLILGPFQGSVSCVEIKLGEGVCGEVATKCQTLIVNDVTKRKNYIACDSRAMSEIVVPLVSSDDKLIGVLDLDAPEVGAYDEVDKEYLEKFTDILLELTDWKFFTIGED